MKILIKFCFLSVVLLIIFNINIVYADEGCFVYSENFNSEYSPPRDIGWTSLNNNYAYWETNDGYYFVKTKDDLTHKYWAYSPDFGTVNTFKQVKIGFDILFENQDWGTYPGVSLTKERPDNISVPYVIRVDNAYRNSYVKQIGVYDAHGHKYYTPQVKNYNWYRIEILYLLSGKADIVVTDLETDTKIYEVKNTDFIITPFRYLAVGYYNKPDYGDAWSPIRLDNVYILSNDLERCDYRFAKSDMSNIRSEGYNAGIKAGKLYCKNNPVACGIYPVDNTTSSCATYNSDNKTLHIPCFSYGSDFWLDLKLIGVNPFVFQLIDYGVK